MNAGGSIEILRNRIALAVFARSFSERPNRQQKAASPRRISIPRSATRAGRTGRSPAGSLN